MSFDDSTPDLPECEPVRTCDVGRTVPGGRTCGRQAVDFWMRTDMPKYVGLCRSPECVATRERLILDRLVLPKWRAVTIDEVDVLEVQTL
jgi:hypothetical protein